MAEQGDPKRFRNEVDSYFGKYGLELTYNFHRGVHNWDPMPRTLQEQCDIAAAVQAKFSSIVHGIMFRAKDLTKSDSLVYMGGCAMNSDANKEFEHLFKYRWTLPYPGDPSSSIGAVAYHTKQRIWRDDWAPVKHLAINV
jgi:predicted NodU family carbamoyl transferase